MDIELSDNELHTLVSILISEVKNQRDQLRSEERFEEVLFEKICSKDEEIEKLRAELKALKAANAAALGKRGPGRPKKAVA